MKRKALEVFGIFTHDISYWKFGTWPECDDINNNRKKVNTTIRPNITLVITTRGRGGGKVAKVKKVEKVGYAKMRMQSIATTIKKETIKPNIVEEVEQKYAEFLVEDEDCDFIGKIINDMTLEQTTEAMATFDEIKMSEPNISRFAFLIIPELKTLANMKEGQSLCK